MSPLPPISLELASSDRIEKLHERALNLLKNIKEKKNAEQNILELMILFFRIGCKESVWCDPVNYVKAGFINGIFSNENSLLSKKISVVDETNIPNYDPLTKYQFERVGYWRGLLTETANECSRGFVTPIPLIKLLVLERIGAYLVSEKKFIECSWHITVAEDLVEIQCALNKLEKEASNTALPNK